MVLKKESWKSTQTKSLICPGRAMWHPQDYGVEHYLDDSLFDNPSFHVKKLHHKTLSHIFSRVDDRAQKICMLS
jgi:hypothetical protein